MATATITSEDMAMSMFSYIAKLLFGIKPGAKYSTLLICQVAISIIDKKRPSTVEIRDWVNSFTKLTNQGEIIYIFLVSFVLLNSKML